MNNLLSAFGGLHELFAWNRIWPKRKPLSSFLEKSFSLGSGFLLRTHRPWTVFYQILLILSSFPSFADSRRLPFDFSQNPVSERADFHFTYVKSEELWFSFCLLTFLTSYKNWWRKKNFFLIRDDLYMDLILFSLTIFFFQRNFGRYSFSNEIPTFQIRDSVFLPYFFVFVMDMNQSENWTFKICFLFWFDFYGLHNSKFHLSQFHHLLSHLISYETCHFRGSFPKKPYPFKKHFLPFSFAEWILPGFWVLGLEPFPLEYDLAVTEAITWVLRKTDFFWMLTFSFWSQLLGMASWFWCWNWIKTFGFYSSGIALAGCRISDFQNENHEIISHYDLPMKTFILGNKSFYGISVWDF